MTLTRTVWPNKARNGMIVIHRGEEHVVSFDAKDHGFSGADDSSHSFIVLTSSDKSVSNYANTSQMNLLAVDDFRLEVADGRAKRKQGVLRDLVDVVLWRRER